MKQFKVTKDSQRLDRINEVYDMFERANNHLNGILTKYPLLENSLTDIINEFNAQFKLCREEYAKAEDESVTLVDFHEEYFAEAYDMLAKYLNDYGQG